MRKIIVKLMAFALAAFLLLTLSVSALADTASIAVEDGILQLGKKTAKQLVVPGRYEITVAVPGAVETEKYSEVIVMVDASSSQGANLEKLKTMLVDLAHEILNGDKSVKLTLMGYGMGPKLVGSYYDADTLESWIAGIAQADLRQGVSATNCEGALEFINDYINSSDKLDKTFVVFTSDGKTNMDETTFALSQWQEHPEWWAKKVTAETIIAVAAGGLGQLLTTSGIIVSAVAELYPNEAEALALTRNKYGISSDEYTALVDALYNRIISSKAEGAAFVDALWADVLAAAGYDYANGAYSTSELERAFIDYYGGVFCNSYYYTIHRMKDAGVYPDYYNLATWGQRSSAAADRLAENAKVTELYMMDFSARNTIWMNPASTSAYHCSSSKISYHTAQNFSAAVDLIGSLGSELFVTLFKDATITDPMSQWVTLDPSTICIYDGDKLIYRYGTGWLYENNQPAEEPIRLEVNSDGRYQITWRIKDGPLMYTDRFSLRYIVDLDKTVPGFEYGAYYPANDATYVTYIDQNGETKTAEVPVPEVKQDEEVVFGEDDRGIKLYKSSSVDGTPLSDIQFDVYHVIRGPEDELTPNPPKEEYGKYLSEENKVTTLTTNANGHAYMNITELGYTEEYEYFLFVELPNPKVKAPADPFYVSVPGIDPVTKERLDVVSIYPKNEPVDTPPPPPPIEEREYGTFSVIKHKEDDPSVRLAGAQFQVYRLAEEGESYSLTTVHNGIQAGLVPLVKDDATVLLTTDENGYAVSPKLDYGMYYIVETRSPDGYNINIEPIAVFATKTGSMAEYATLIPNTPGMFLPETGGMGTTIFLVVGAVLVIGAVVLLVTKKRMSAENEEN